MLRSFTFYSLILFDINCYFLGKTLITYIVDVNFVNPEDYHTHIDILKLLLINVKLNCSLINFLSLYEFTF